MGFFTTCSLKSCLFVDIMLLKEQKIEIYQGGFSVCSRVKAVTQLFLLIPQTAFGASINSLLYA